MNFISEHGIGSYEDLVELCNAASATTFRVKAALRDAEQKISDLTVLSKHITTYRELKPIYDRYKTAFDKEKFLRGFESEIILFEAAARAIQTAGLSKLPSDEKLKSEMNDLTARKIVQQSEYKKAQNEEREYDTIRQNVDALLDQPLKKGRKKEMEIL